MEMPQPPYPLHESVAQRLALQYVTFYNQYLLNAQQTHHQPIATSRVGKVVGGSPGLPVGRTFDLSIGRQESHGDAVPIRVFVPDGQAPEGGWPLMLYYHGGGWVLGDISTENAVCTNMCARARHVVITTDYRLAPEHPFPAAVHDSLETILWVTSEGQELLNLDLSKAAIGGASAGANLAAVMTQKVAVRPRLAQAIHFKTQLLVVPVTDNTATVETNATYREYEHTAALPAAKMLWYREHYLPQMHTRCSPEASPLLFPPDRFGDLPPAVVLVAELDIVRHEGEEYAKKLRDAGVDVRLEVMVGCPHAFLSMDAVLDEGRRAVDILCETLKEAVA